MDDVTAAHRPFWVIAGDSSPVTIVAAMTEYRVNGSRTSVLRGLVTIGGRAAAVTVKPFSGVMGAAAGAGIDLERRAMDRLIESGELERLLASARIQSVAAQLLDSDGARRLVDAFFDSGLFDQFVDRLLASDALWRMIDEIAASPAVTAAISQQGLGFADQVGDELRSRSRTADAWVARAARRLTRREPGAVPPVPPVPPPPVPPVPPAPDPA